MSDTVVLSVIVVSWNVCDLLRECLHSISQGLTIPPDDYEIIVVDNASTDGSLDMARTEFPSARLIANVENLGFARANNRALGSCRGEYILLLNPDTVPLAHALDYMLDFLSDHPDVAILGCRLLNTDRSFQRASGGAFPSLRNVAWNYLLLNKFLPPRWAPSPRYLEKDPQGTFDVDWVSGAATMCRTAALGGRLFDERFFLFAEDMELCARVRRNGWRVVYTSAATIIHHHGRSFEKQDSPEVESLLVKGPRTFYIMHNGPSGVWAYDLIMFTGHLLRGVAYSVLCLVSRGSRHCKNARLNLRCAGVALRMLFGKARNTEA